MKLLHALIGTLLALLLAGAALAGERRIIVVRHAEKASDGTADPVLTDAGRERARTLAQWLRGLPLEAVYATPFRRTIQTAAPTAAANRLPVSVRAAREDAAALAEAVRHHRGHVLVVGHSNTVPAIVQALSGEAVAAMDETVYERIFIVYEQDDGSRRLERAVYPPPEAGAGHGD